MPTTSGFKRQERAITYRTGSTIAVEVVAAGTAAATELVVAWVGAIAMDGRIGLASVVGIWIRMGRLTPTSTAEVAGKIEFPVGF